MALWNKARRAAEKLIAPGSNVSYAQAGEDLVLDFLADYAPAGFYVDVGCNHPIRQSNTYRFYRKGWSGIAIDANPAFAQGFARHRPRDRFIRACVSDTEGQVPFHVFASDSLSSISGKQLYDNADHYRLERVEQLTTRTLNDILTEAGAPGRVDILSIDVEGHDEQVIRSLDLHRFEPKIIVVELNAASLNIGRVAEHPVAAVLADHDFQPVAVHWGNVFFRR